MIDGGSSVILIFRMVFSLIIVLGALFVLVRFLQRRQGGGLRAARKSGVPVRVVTRHSLSRATSIQVVEVGRTTLVLGVSDSGVNVLREIPADTVIDTRGGGVGEPLDQADPDSAGDSTAEVSPAASRGRSAQTAKQAFEHTLSQILSGQARQAKAIPGQLPTRAGRHRA